MSCLLGIDLGTSSVKVVAFGVEGALKGTGVAEYPILTPRLGYAEQNPEDWWRATVTAADDLRNRMAQIWEPEVAHSKYEEMLADPKFFPVWWRAADLIGVGPPDH